MPPKNRKITRKGLPNNYVQLTFQKIELQDINTTYASVYDVIRGKNKNQILTILVKKALKEVKEEFKNLKKKAMSKS